MAQKMGAAQVLALVLGLGSACGPGPMAPMDREPDQEPPDPMRYPVRVYHNPYADVDWAFDRRLLMQLHDHARTDLERIDAYDAAGYELMPLFHYFGMPENAGAWDELRWPASDWLDSEYIDSLESIEQFYPGGELGVSWHLTTPFLSTYIERWDREYAPNKLDYQFEDDAELIEMVWARGGYPVLAHPWAPVSEFLGFSQVHAVEVYSAFGEINHLTGVAEHQPNALMEDVWNALLEQNPYVLGVAVNDWHGPFCETPGCLEFPRAKDSGKVELLAPSSALADIERAFAHGAMFAVKDYGLSKLDYPRIERVELGPGTVTIVTAGTVEWISHGSIVGEGPSFELADVTGARHLRAEVRDAQGSRVFVQPLVLAPFGDIDGDGDIDASDLEQCDAVLNGLELDPDRVAAVEALGGCPELP